MKRLRFYAMAMLLIGAIVATQQTVNSQSPPATATIHVRIFFGEQMGKIFTQPCATIKVVATPKNGQPIKKAAHGPRYGATGGQCTASLKNVPTHVQIELKAVLANFYSKPDDTHEPPAGQWTNPLILKAGEAVVRYIKLDVKP